MGRDKARLRAGGRTLLAHVRHTARQMGLPIRVIRRDLVARCGPLGGVLTALKTTRSERVLFLACDMPLVPVALLKKVLRAGSAHDAVFVTGPDGPGFPFLLRRHCLPSVEALIASRDRSLRSLARHCHARLLRARAVYLTNVNTPADLDALDF